MTTDGNSKPWWHAAINRQRSLAIASPLQELESNKGHVGAQKHDVRSYCLYVIDQVLLGMRANRGERLDTVEKALSQLIGRCEPNASEELKGRTVAYVIDGLLNARRRGPFIETLTLFDEHGEPRRERYPFTLLEAKDIGDDFFYLAASPQAIRLYTDLLARDVTDEQVANECLFRFLVERGEWQKAADESGRMELLSLEYEQTVRKAVEQTEINVRAIDWKDTIIPLLRRARQHVGDRVRAENSVLGSLRDKLGREEALSDDDRRKLVRIEEILNGVICRHTRLAQVLLQANEKFAEAQNSQCYRPRQVSSFADLERELLRPLLMTSVGQLLARAEQLAEFIVRPEPRPLASLVEIVDRLLQAEREPHAANGESDSDLEIVEPEPPFLTRHDDEQANALLNSIGERCLLSDVLAEMASQGLTRKARDRVVTDLLKAIGQSAGSLRVCPCDGHLSSLDYSGNELMIEPRAPCSKTLTHNVA